MPEIVQDAATFKADRAWGARDLAEIDGATVRLHWTDQPYKWHRNDGPEAFVVLSGQVDMHYRAHGTELCVRLAPSDIFIANEGDEHVAHPIGEARILVIERKGSIRHHRRPANVRQVTATSDLFSKDRKGCRDRTN